MKDYSQGGEQAIILEQTADIVEGRFLDIGAHRATDLSNTRALVERGWSGVLVEPIPEHAFDLMRACMGCGEIPADGGWPRENPALPKCCANRESMGCYGEADRIKIIAAAVSHERDILQFRATTHGVSTAVEADFQKWEKYIHYYGRVYVPSITVEDIINRYGAFDVISVDTEGMNSSVFFNLPLASMKPRLVVVEHNGERIIEMDRFAFENGYKKVFASGENAIYVI